MKVEKNKPSLIKWSSFFGLLICSRIATKSSRKNLVNELLQIAHWTRLRSIEPTQISRELCGTLRYYSKDRNYKNVG